MGTIYTYNTLRDEHNTITGNGRLKYLLPDLDYEHSLILKAGNRLGPDYEVQPDDVLFVRKVPGALSATTLAWVAIGLTVLTVVGGVAYGIHLNNEMDKKIEKAQKDAKNLAQQAQQLPFIRGAKNRSALGETVQFLMGSCYNTPYNLTSGFYSIDGTDGVNSYYNAVFSAGYGSQKISELMLGNETIASNADGISGQQDFDSDSLYYDESNANKVEVRQPGEAITLTDCNQKVSSTYSGAELKHEYEEDAEPVIVQAAENAQKIQVCIQFSSLRKYDTEDSNWEERTVTVRPYWSNDGGTNWYEFTFDGSTDNVFTKNANRNIRFVATKTFTAAESFGKSISIKVVKETAKLENNSQEDCCLLWYQTFQYDAETSTESELYPCQPIKAQLYNKATRIAYRIVANDSTESMLDELHAMAEGYAYTWNGSAWSETKTTTRNPASWLIEVLTSPTHPASQYQLSELDLDSFGALYEYCETNNFYCDGIITAEEKKLDIITKILGLCNSTLILNQEGLLEVCIDKPEETPVALLNTENIVSFTFNKSMQRQADGTKVNFTNRESWTIDTFYSMLDGGDYDYASDTVDALSLDYVTTHAHAYKISQRRLRQAQLQPTDIKADVGSEGDYYPLYSKILVQLPHLLQGLNSSVIKTVNYNDNNQITSITISDAVEIVAGSRYGVIIQATNDYGFRLYSAEITAGVGQTRTLTLTSPLSIVGNIAPCFGNHLSFGLLDANEGFTTVTHAMKIYGIEPNGDDGFTLTLKDYNEEVYNYGTIPEFKSNITRPQKPKGSVSIDSFLESQKALKNELMTNINVSVENLYANHIITLYKETDEALETSGITSNLIYNFRTNGVSWDGPGDNGWSITMPANPTNQVWVTSATAHGKGETDSIAPNEWAQPIVMGQNGSNGVNTATITLYKRQATTPELIPALLTYYFADASIVCADLSGWTTSIPDVRTDGNPCWEIHATALSTGSSDSIPSGATWAESGWSTPTRIMQDGLTEQDVLELIGDVQNESPNVYATPVSGTIAVDENGIVPSTQTVSMTIRVVQNNEDIDFTFGTITPPDGVTVNAVGHVLNITVAAGTRLETSYIQVPVIFRSYRNNDYLVDEDGTPLVWFSAEEQFFYGEIDSLSDLPASQTNSWFQWTGADTQSTEEIVEDGVFEKDAYYTYSNKWVKVGMIPLGIETEAVEDSRYEITYTLTPKQGGVYAGPISATASIPSDPVINDFFTWTGTNETSYAGVQYGQLLTGCCYKWTGSQWVKDTGPLHRAEAMKDLLGVAESMLAANNSDIITMVRDLIAWNVVTENIRVTGEAIINSTITAELILDDEGFIESANYGENSGFRINADGSAVFNNITARGNIQASSITSGLAEDINDDNRELVAQKLGYSDWADMVTKSGSLGTIFDTDTGYLRTSLIEVQQLLAQNITLDASGYMQSSNYSEVGGYPTAGFKIDAANNLIKACGGIFNNVEVTGAVTATAGRFEAGLGEGFEYTFLDHGVPDSVVTESLGDDIVNRVGLLVVFTGDSYRTTGTGSLPVYLPIYSRFCLYFYGYTATSIGIDLNNHDLIIQKIFGDRDFISVAEPEDARRKCLQITNRPGNTGIYERHARIYNLKIW